MRLFEAIREINQRRVRGDQTALVPRPEFAGSLPVVALTCIDVRLNPLLPQALGVAEEDFIWLRNAGNIITGTLSSTMRSLALACAIKGGKEIVVIGHADCLVAKTTMLQLTSALTTLGIARDRLPENLTEFFGLFASERQNVIKAAEFVRQSPLIGPKIPVHGLLLDLATSRLEWLVNGYEPRVATDSALKLEASIGGKEVFAAKVGLPGLALGELQFPEVKIGDLRVGVATETAPAGTAKPAAPTATPSSGPAPAPGGPPPADWMALLRQLFGERIRFHVIGNDMKRYGPAPAEKVLEWLAEKRIHERTPAQVEGTTSWQPLNLLIPALRGGKHAPPRLPAGSKPASSPLRFFRKP